MITASGGDSGDSSWDHDDGGSRGVTWADQKTDGMLSGGSNRDGATPTQAWSRCRWTRGQWNGERWLDRGERPVEQRWQTAALGGEKREQQ